MFGTIRTTVIRLLLALALAAGLAPAVGTSLAAAATPTPTGLTALSTSRSGISVGWKAVSGASHYRLQVSRSSSMKNATYTRVAGTQRDLTGLKSSTTYYIKVRVITANGGNLSPYSKAIKVKTRAKSGYPQLSPVSLATTATTANSMSLSWASRGSGIRYRVTWATKSNFSDAKYARFTPTSATISGLKASTTYYVRVRVITTDGGNLSAYSPAITVKTPAAAPSTGGQTATKPPAAGSAPLRVVSYNVKCANCYSALPNEGTWYERRDTVVAAVAAQAPDVIGFQEASQGWLKDDAGKPVSLSQFEDLVNRLGSPYKLTNTNRNNCVKSTTPTKCVYKDQGASQGSKIIYNSKTLTLVSQGSVKLTEVKASDNDRYLAWAVFTQKSTGKDFFFGDTQLSATPSGGNATTYYNGRITQTKDLLAAIAAHNKDKLPVYMVGDFNSSKWANPANAPYDLMTAAGYVDPLGNTYRSTKTATGATVVTRIATNISSFNSFNRKAPITTYVNGSYLDYIWTSKGVQVPEWQTVVDIDAAGNFVGIIPSDHNMIRATTYLP